MSSEHKKAMKAQALEEAMEDFDFTGWTRFTEWHFQIDFHGYKLNYWPSTGTWYYRDKVKHGEPAILREYMNWWDSQLYDPYAETDEPVIDITEIKMGEKDKEAIPDGSTIGWLV